MSFDSLKVLSVASPPPRTRPLVITVLLNFNKASDPCLRLIDQPTICHDPTATAGPPHGKSAQAGSGSPYTLLEEQMALEANQLGSGNL